MDDFARAAGFKGLITKRRKFHHIVKTAAEDERSRREFRASDDRRATECYRYCGKGFGLAAYYQKNSESVLKMRRWEVFAESDHVMGLSDIFVERGMDGQFYAFCEDEETGSEFEFRLNNMIEYRQKRASFFFKGAPFYVNMAGLASRGTVLMPSPKYGRSLRFNEFERSEYKELLTRARRGDIVAESALNDKALEMAVLMRERLKSRDLLSALEGYLLPVGDLEGVFAVLGDITGVDGEENEITGENVLRLSVDIIGIRLTVYVNAGDLLGDLMVGTRFLGICKLQGSIVF